MKKLEVSKIYHTLCKPSIDYTNYMYIDTIQRQKLTQNPLQL